MEQSSMVGDIVVGCTFVSTCSTVLECMFSSPECLMGLGGGPVLVDSFGKVSSVAECILPGSFEEEMIVSFSEFCVIVVEMSHDVVIDYEVLFSLIDCQLDNVEKGNDGQVLSLLLVIYYTITEIGNLIMIEFISGFLKINYVVKFCKSTGIQRLLITVYYEVLNLEQSKKYRTSRGIWGYFERCGNGVAHFTGDGMFGQLLDFGYRWFGADGLHRASS